MIKQVRIKNFKTLANNEFELKNLNIFTGINGMGKSTFLQTLLMLRQSYIQNNMNSILINGDYTYLGSGVDVLFSGADPYDSIVFELEYADKKYSINFNYQFKEDTEEENSASKDSDTMRIKDKSTLSPDFFNKSLFLNDNHFQYLNAERIGPRVQNDMNSISTRERKELGKNGEFALDYLSNYGPQKVTNEYVIHKNDAGKGLDGWDNLENQVNAWLSDITPGTKLHTSRDTEAKKIKGSYSFSGAKWKYKPVNVGFGLTYALPVILALLTTKVGGTVIIENPESHLHPKGQSKMAELIARCAASGVQVFVETHSDHIINGIMVATYEHYKAKKFYNDQLELIKKFDKEISLNPNNANAYSKRGSAKLEIGKIEEAKKDFIKAIDLGLNIFKVQGNLASLDTPQEAIKEYAKQIELDPKNILLYGNRGSILYNLKKFEDAIKDFDKAIELNPSDSTYYRSRALAKEELNRIDDANKDWETASNLDIPSKKIFSESEVGISSEDVAIYYFSRKEGNNFSDVAKINLTETGRITKPPKGFFDQFNTDLKRLL
ncbi:MAG TPA: DUF3696 domain-containing protein [Leptospiraceae bacterium]|nr:DUF3696 domain-containing protein [Leptospiraceae bacterium]